MPSPFITSSTVQTELGDRGGSSLQPISFFFYILYILLHYSQFSHADQEDRWPDIVVRTPRSVYRSNKNPQFSPSERGKLYRRGFVKKNGCAVVQQRRHSQGRPHLSQSSKFFFFFGPADLFRRHLGCRTLLNCIKYIQRDEEKKKFCGYFGINTKSLDRCRILARNISPLHIMDGWLKSCFSPARELLAWKNK